MDIKDPDVVVHLRLPKSLHKQLKTKSVKNVRTVNGEIIVAIRRHLTGTQPADEATAESNQEVTA